MDNIRSVKVIRCEAFMLAADVLDLIREHNVDLPPECFLSGLADYAAPDDPVVLSDLCWFGEWSGHSYFKVFLPHVAPKIRGILEVIWTWGSGDPSGLRIVDGKVTQPEVVMTLVKEGT